MTWRSVLQHADGSFAVPGSLHEGRYVVGPKLGAGGMATVHHCTDGELQVERAVKLRRRSGGPSEAVALQRLADEAHIMARLNHPRVLPVYDIGQEGPWHYVVMELAIEALADRMDRDGPMGPQDAVRLMVDVLAAVDAAHNQGIIHRDIKPQNILLGADGRPWLADWGIARLSDREQTLTRTHVGMGSLAYMAPEQRQDAHGVTEVADIYAVGATLYHLVTAETSVDLFHAKPTSPRWDGVPDSLRAIVQRATALKPGDRYGSAADMAVALTEVLPLLPVEPVSLGAVPAIDGGTLTSMPEETVEPVGAAAPAAPESTSWFLILSVGAVGVAVVAILAAIALPLGLRGAGDSPIGAPVDVVTSSLASDPAATLEDPAGDPDEGVLDDVEAPVPEVVSGEPSVETPPDPAGSGDRVIIEPEPDTAPDPGTPDDDVDGSGEPAESEVASAAEVPAPTVASLPIHGPWRGSLNGNVARLSLDGPTDGLRGWLILQGERGPVAGRYLADTKELVLEVSGPESAAGRWTLSFEEGRLDGRVERSESSDMVPVHLARMP